MGNCNELRTLTPAGWAKEAESKLTELTTERKLIRSSPEAILTSALSCVVYAIQGLCAEDKAEPQGGDEYQGQALCAEICDALDGMVHEVRYTNSLFGYVNGEAKAVVEAYAMPAGREAIERFKAILEGLIWRGAYRKPEGEEAFFGYEFRTTLFWRQMPEYRLESDSIRTRFAVYVERLEE